MKSKTQCPALIISAPASGQGKTTVTAAIARKFRLQGKKVRIFKTGPDFIDPFILEKASKHPVLQLDLWMASESHCRKLLFDAAISADLILIEGVMGLFDGDSSTADLAIKFNISVMTVIDASAMAQTFSALAYGLMHYKTEVRSAGVFANNIGSDYHFKLIQDALPSSIRCLGWLKRDSKNVFPERHLGLHQASEIELLDNKLSDLASLIQLHELEKIKPTTFYFDEEVTADIQPQLKGLTIGVARDNAFSFLYYDNIHSLKELGASIIYFTPLMDTSLPPVDALYFPGGYPELYANELASNKNMYFAIRQHYNDNKPIVAECGGMMYLSNSLSLTDGTEIPMVGVFDANVTMQENLSAIAYQETTIDSETIHGHTFHHSTIETDVIPFTKGLCPNGGKTNETVYRSKNLTASYIHHYFKSNLSLTATLFKS